MYAQFTNHPSTYPQTHFHPSIQPASQPASHPLTHPISIHLHLSMTIHPFIQPPFFKTCRRHSNCYLPCFCQWFLMLQVNGHRLGSASILSVQYITNSRQKRHVFLMFFFKQLVQYGILSHVIKVFENHTAF